MTRESIRDGLAYLVQKDPCFKHVLQLIGPPTMLLSLIGKELPDAFTTLAQTICHQQLSLKVCQRMFQRLLDLCGDREVKTLDPERVLAAKPEKIREVAQLSFRKISYIQQMAEKFARKELSSQFFAEASDEEVRSALMTSTGIGEWTAEMFLIFQLQRHGAYIYGDVAFQKALRMVYNLRAPPDVTKYCEVSWSPTRAQMELCVRRWGPYSTIASLYMLRLADNENSAIFLPDELGTNIDVSPTLELECDSGMEHVAQGRRGRKRRLSAASASDEVSKFGVDLNRKVLYSNQSSHHQAFEGKLNPTISVLDIT
jgi:DNA-3-methyladenine glycosylase II